MNSAQLPNRCIMALVLLSLHYLGKSGTYHARSVLFPTIVRQPTFGGSPNEVGAYQSNRLRWGIPMDMWHRALPAWNLLGWQSIPMEIRCSHLHVNHWSCYAGILLLLG